MIGQNEDHREDFYCLLNNRGNSSSSSAFLTLCLTSLDIQAFIQCSKNRIKFTRIWSTFKTL